MHNNSAPHQFRATSFHITILPSNDVPQQNRVVPFCVTCPHVPSARVVREIFRHAARPHVLVRPLHCSLPCTRRIRVSRPPNRPTAGHLTMRSLPLVTPRHVQLVVIRQSVQRSPRTNPPPRLSATSSATTSPCFTCSDLT